VYVADLGKSDRGGEIALLRVRDVTRGLLELSSAKVGRFAPGPASVGEPRRPEASELSRRLLALAGVHPGFASLLLERAVDLPQEEFSDGSLAIARRLGPVDSLRVESGSTT
jgi:hypothetical protein